MALSPAARNATSDASLRTFYPVGGTHLEKFDVISEIFHRILTPLYGSQEKALNQIRLGQDRKSFLLYEGETPVGVLVFKTMLSNEFRAVGVEDSIEIKSLFVDHAAQNSGKGLGSTLLDKLNDEISKLGLPSRGVHVTVSETKQESLTFFRKKGFQIVQEWKGRYSEGVTEYLLSCPLRIAAPASAMQNAPTLPYLLRLVADAHWDDIHALKKLSDGTFVSGSKDGSLHKWSANGDLVRIVDEAEPTHDPERNWITAVGVINDAYWISGERNGKVCLWKTSGDCVKEIKLKTPKQEDHISHPLNKRRVNCFATGLNPHKPSFFVGFPTMFDEYNLIEGRTDSCTKVHTNDWVYCVQPLSESSVIMVTGGSVDVWNRGERDWRYGRNLLPEGSRYKDSNGKSQRAFISSLTPLKADPNQCGLACFDGSVKILNMTQGKATKEWKEHKDRVWSIENIDENTFASCGEDRTVKIWDARHSKSVRTIPDHVGQVTTMLSLNETTFVVGTCPDRAFKQRKGAELRFYDMRK